MLVGYFTVNAYTGDRGLRAQQDLDLAYSQLTDQLKRLRVDRAYLEHRVRLLRSESIDPDMLDERTRAILHYLDPHELELIRPRP